MMIRMIMMIVEMIDQNDFEGTIFVIHLRKIVFQSARRALLVRRKELAFVKINRRDKPSSYKTSLDIIKHAFQDVESKCLIIWVMTCLMTSEDVL